MNSSYPQFEYSLWDSLTPQPRVVARTLGYGFLGFFLLPMYLIWRSGEEDRMLVALLFLSPFLLFSLIMKCAGCARTHFVAEPHQLVSYNSWLGMRFKRTVLDVSTVRQWVLKLRCVTSYSADGNHRHVEDNRMHNFIIQVTAEHGESDMAEIMRRDLAQDFVAFLQTHYPQVSYENKLVEEDELAFEATERRQVLKMIIFFEGFGILFLLFNLLAGGSEIKPPNWDLVGTQGLGMYVLRLAEQIVMIGALVILARALQKSWKELRQK